MDGRIAFVTGAGTGIGRATCVRLAEAGATVVATSRTLAHARETCAELRRASGREGHAFALDVADRASVDEVVEEIARRFGRIDVVVANAGFTLTHAPSLPETTDEEWEEVFRVNVFGVFAACRAALRHMHDGGAIVTVGSINSFVAWENDGAYTASKGAVLQFTRALALDVASRGIRVNSVCPGVIDTPLTQAFLDRAKDPAALAAEYAAVAPLNRMGQPEEIANCILFLASQEASFVTGAALIADGGTVIRP
jgi:NAD(P)-dependent dehydrogenase (short-subunit alcohol dehydrogenase family)